jgi:polyadenylate-binding protein
VNFQNPADAESALERLNFTEIKPGKPIRIMWSLRDPTMRKAGNANIFIKNLDPEIDNRTLKDTFQMYGNILSCKIATGEDGKSLGYGFVHFEKDESATEAIEKVNESKLGSQEVNVSRFVKKQDREREEEKVFKNVYIKNLKDSTTEDQVKAWLTTYGTPTNIFLGSNPHHSSKFALVTFEKHESCVDLIEKCHDKDHELAAPDHKLYVARALKKRDRQAAKARNQQSSLYQSQGRNVYVKHLDDSITQEKFEELFAQW